MREGNSDQVDYARKEFVWGIWEAAHISCKGLSKACIHKENKLKTRPMKPRQYIYKIVRMYWNVQGCPCKCNWNEVEDSRSNWNAIEASRIWKKRDEESRDAYVTSSYHIGKTCEIKE